MGGVLGSFAFDGRQAHAGDEGRVAVNRELRSLLCDGFLLLGLADDANNAIVGLLFHGQRVSAGRRRWMTDRLSCSEAHFGSAGTWLSPRH